MSKVSTVLILMPVLNESANIEASIRSIQEQSFENWTLIIQDNFSDDGTAEIITRFVTSDSRINLVRGLSRLNVQDNWSTLANQALSTYDSSFVIWMGGDDLWSTRDFLKNKIDKFKISPNVSCIASGVRNFGTENSELISLGSTSKFRLLRLYDYLKDYKQINTLWALIPRDTFTALVKHKSFNLGGFPGFDWYFCLGLFLHGKVCFDSDSIYLKRARSNTSTINSSVKRNTGIESYKAFMSPYTRTFWTQSERLKGLRFIDALVIVLWQAVVSHYRLFRNLLKKL